MPFHENCFKIHCVIARNAIIKEVGKSAGLVKSE